MSSVANLCWRYCAVLRVCIDTSLVRVGVCVFALWFAVCVSLRVVAFVCVCVPSMCLLVLLCCVCFFN